MGKEGTNTMKIMVTSFVLVLLAIAFLTSIVTQTATITERTAVASEAHALDVNGFPEINETTNYTVTNAPSGWKTEDCLLTNFVVANASGSALTLTTDYTVDLATGKYLLVNTTATKTTFGLYGPDNNTYASYDYCGDDYVSQSWARNVLNVNVGMFAVAILTIVILLVYVLLGKEGQD